MTIYINERFVKKEAVLHWIDEHWQDAQELHCTHFEAFNNVFAPYCIASVWMRGMSSVEDYKTCKRSEFEESDNGWIVCYKNWSWLCYKNGTLFYISQHS